MTIGPRKEVKSIERDAGDGDPGRNVDLVVNLSWWLPGGWEWGPLPLEEESG